MRCKSELKKDYTKSHHRKLLRKVVATVSPVRRADWNDKQGVGEEFRNSELPTTRGFQEAKPKAQRKVEQLAPVDVPHSK